MSNKKSRDRIDNSLTELTLGLKAYATGGSQLSGLGTLAYSNNYGLISQQRIILTYLYTGNGIFQTAVHVPIQDAIGKGITIESGELAPDEIDEIIDWMEEKGAWGAIEQGEAWARLFGGGGIIINTPDKDTTKPLRLKENTTVEFIDFDRWMITGNPDDDTIRLNGVEIHRSRIIFMKGKPAPNHVRQQLQGWGMSEGERMIRDLQLYLKTDDVLYEILDESKIDVYHIAGFANKLATVGGTSTIRQRIQEANKIKSYVNALVLDANEEFEQKSTTFTGLAEVKRENRIGVACALRMPMTKLFGISASGFSTGENDTDNYNEMVESEIRAKMRPAIRQCIEWACYNLWGYCPSFRISFPSLKVLPEVEAAQVRESKANTILSLYDRGLVTSGKAIGDELAKEEVISAELAAVFADKPIPPNGSQSVAPVETNTITAFRQKTEGMRNAVKKLMRGKEK